jgi:hypothetical protein
MQHCARDESYFAGYPAPDDKPSVTEMSKMPNTGFSRVREIYLDFADGNVAGSIEGCTAIEVADALERIAQFLRAKPDGIEYVDFDEGKISACHRPPNTCPAWNDCDDADTGSGCAGCQHRED